MTLVASEKARHGMVREALTDVLMDRAAWTHARLQSGRDLGVELHEETITQDLQLDISAALPAMMVRTFTKRQEARTGADWQWEWWFEGRQWFGLRVQAKRLKRLPSGQLGYDLGYQRGGNQRQIDLLIDDARRARVPAAYVLYNGPDLDISKFTWGCHRLPPSPAFFGVSLLPAMVARDLVNAGTVDFTTVGARSRPWSCLASCDWPECHPFQRPEKTSPAHPADRSDDLSWRTALSYFHIQEQARLAGELDAEQESASVPRQLPGLRDLPPPYVADFLAQDLLADGAFPRRVGALTIFRATTR
jgi:hypothetical protein